MEVGRLRQALTALTLAKSPGVHCTGGWVGSGKGVENRKSLAPKRFKPRTVQPVMYSLYGLRYSGPV